MWAAIGWLMVNSSMPRTSPTFQSRFGLSGCVLWQFTHGAAMMIGVTSRTRRSKIEPETSRTREFGFLPQALQRCPLESVESGGRAIFERVVREKAELGVAVASVDYIPEFE